MQTLKEFYWGLFHWVLLKTEYTDKFDNKVTISKWVREWDQESKTEFIKGELGLEKMECRRITNFFMM